MSDNDTKFERRDANFQRKCLDATDPSRDSFNSQSLSDPFSQETYHDATPEAQSRIRDLILLREQRLETLDKNRDRYREQNIYEEKTKLYEKHLSEPQPIPNTPEARALVLQTIEEQAPKNVDARYEWQKNNIDRNASANIKEIYRRDQQAQRGLGDLSHDREQERE